MAVTVPRVSHLIICTSRVPSSKDMCFSRVLTGVSVLHPENCVWLLPVWRWWQEKHSQLSQSYWRPRGPGLCRPWALWWEQGGGEQVSPAGRQGLAEGSSGCLGFWMPHAWPLKSVSPQVKWRPATQSLLSYKNPKIGAKKWINCSMNYASRKVVLLVSSVHWLGALVA